MSISLREITTYIYTKIYTSVFRTALYCSSPQSETTQMSFNWQTVKLLYLPAMTTTQQWKHAAVDTCSYLDGSLVRCIVKEKANLKMVQTVWSLLYNIWSDKIIEIVNILSCQSWAWSVRVGRVTVALIQHQESFWWNGLYLAWLWWSHKPVHVI